MWRLLVIIFVVTTTVLHAAVVFGPDSKAEGRIVRNDDKGVVLKPPKGDEITFSKENILAVYDDDGNLIWASPTIEQNDPTPEAKNARIEIPAEHARTNYRGLHLGFMGSIGILWPNATFSSFPLGASPDYQPTADFNAALAWYTEDTQAWVASLGYALRRIPIHGIIADNVMGDGTWPMQHLDLRGGYRFHSDIFYLEAGFLAAIKMTNAPLQVQTTLRTIESDAYTPRSYLALYAALGAKVPLTARLNVDSALRVDHAITPAIAGYAPTATDVNGQTVSSAKLSLLPISVSFQLGLSWKL